MNRAARVLAVLVALSFPCLSRGQTFQDAINTMKDRLGGIETRLAAVESTSRIDSATVGDEISRAVDAHAQAAKTAFETVMSELRAGRQEGLDHARDFESTMKDQRGRAEKAVAKIAEIEANIRTGRVKLTRPVLESLTPAERRQFRRTLRPEVDDEYRRDLPTLFPGARPPIAYMSDEEWLALKQETCGSCGQVATLNPNKDPNLLKPSLLQQMMDAIVPPVHAAVAYGCYTICAASFGWGCVYCVTNGTAAAVAAYNTFVSCRRACCRCRWYKPWCCACRGACWVAFLATLA